MFQLDISEHTEVQPTILWNPNLETNYIELLDKYGIEKGVIFEKSWKNWSPFLREESEGIITEVTEPKTVLINIKQLPFVFSKLKDTDEIELFSKKYGLLGIQAPPREQWVEYEPLFDKNMAFEKSSYGYCYYEPLLLWKWHIKNVRRILRLYSALKKENKGNEIEIEDSILRVQELSGPVKNIKSNIKEEYGVYWADGEFTYLDISSPEELSYKELGETVLVDSIIKRIEGGFNLYAKDKIKDETKDIGFQIPERRRTPYLLAVIYYGIWQLINNSANIEICDNPNCRQPFEKKGRGKHCNPACRQAAYRAREKVKKMDR